MSSGDCPEPAQCPKIRAFLGTYTLCSMCVDYLLFRSGI
jgi:hypothetical protein